MEDMKDGDTYHEELLDYEEEEEAAPDALATKASGDAGKKWGLKIEMKTHHMDNLEILTGMSSVYKKKFSRMSSVYKKKFSRITMEAHA